MKCSRKFNWLKLDRNNSLFGAVTNYDISIELTKQEELKRAYAAVNSFKFGLRRSDLPFRKFIADFEELVDVDFRSRYPSD
jgi:hypothetical protein